MSIRSITVQYIGNVLFLPKLERDVKLVVERDYGTADPDKRFVMERTCRIEHPYYNDAPVINGQPRCSECKTEFSVGMFPNYCPNCGAKVVGE